MNTVRVTRRRLRYEAKAAPRLIREISQRIALPWNLNFFCKGLLSGLLSDVGCKAGSVLRGAMVLYYAAMVRHFG